MSHVQWQWLSGIPFTLQAHFCNISPYGKTRSLS
jgi:hypothetical protein